MLEIESGCLPSKLSVALKIAEKQLEIKVTQTSSTYLGALALNNEPSPHMSNTRVLEIRCNRLDDCCNLYTHCMYVYTHSKD